MEALFFQLKIYKLENLTSQTFLALRLKLLACFSTSIRIHDFYRKSFNDDLRFYDSKLSRDWANYSRCCMNSEKQYIKLLKLQAKADACTSRKEALKILKKSDKAIHKLS